jgi:hypothetical protein
MNGSIGRYDDGYSVHSYLVRLEAVYGVSIKFWLDYLGNGIGGADLFVFVSGSGALFDDIPAYRLPCKQVIHQDEPYAIGQAQFFALRNLELLLSSVRSGDVEPTAL